jgi:hypothetical protein
MPAGALSWDGLADRWYHTGVDHGVLYSQVNGVYNDGVAWNGLTNVTSQPSGAEANPFYADNIKYFNIMSAEQFGATIECYSAPDGFLVYDGVAKTANGLRIGMQARPVFGFSWRSKKANALDEDAGYVLHLAYGLQASPSEKSNQTINESPEPTAFSWTVTSTPVEAGAGYRPTAYIEIDSTDPDVDASNLAALETILYGAVGVAPRLPLPEEVDAILGTGITLVVPEPLSYTDATDTIEYVPQAGVRYWREDTSAEVLADIVLSVGLPALVIVATPAAEYNFDSDEVFVDRWLYEYTP